MKNYTFYHIVKTLILFNEIILHFLMKLCIHNLTQKSFVTLGAKIFEFLRFLRFLRTFGHFYSENRFENMGQ